MPRSRDLSTNTAALVGGNIGSLLLAFGLSVLIGRALGEGGLGAYVAVLAWVFPLLMLAEFGTNTLLTRDLAADLSHTHIYLTHTSHIRYRFGGALLLLLWGAAPLLSDTPAVINGLRTAAPLLLIEPSYGAYTAIFRAHQAMLPIPVLNVGMLAAQVFLTGLVIWSGGGVVAVIGVNTITSAGRLLGAWWLYRTRYHQRPQITPPPPVALVRRAVPFAVAGVMAAAHLRLNYLLLEPIAGAAAVGIYAAGMRFIEAARIVPAAYYDALMPKLVAQAGVSDNVNRGAGLLLLYGLLVGVSATLFAPHIVPFVYGTAFAAAVPVTVLAGWLLLVGLVRELWVVRAYALRQEWHVNRAYVAMLGVGAIAGIVLIPAWGVLGAVLAWSLAELTGVALLFPLRRQIAQLD